MLTVKTRRISRAIVSGDGWEKMLRRVAVGAVLASVMLVAVHAARDRLNAFPDEQLHITTAAYYLDHWLPPPTSTALAPYAGVHGVSYHMLWPPQASYWLYAKASNLAPFVPRWAFYRGLCVLLWLALVVHVLRAARTQPWLYWLVGLTPGVWYVFAYYSPDALSYGVAAVLVTQLVRPESVSRRYIAEGTPRLGAVVLGGLIGLLALSKLNYLTFSGAAFVYCCVLLLRNKVSAQRAFVVIAIAFTVAAPLLFADLANKTRGDDFEQTREQLAGPGFHASDIANGTAYYGFALRDRGVPAAALLHRPWRWGLLTSRSFFGVYGTMDVDPIPRLNDLQFLLGLCLLALIAAGWRGGTLDSQILIATCLVMCAVALIAAFWRAWTFDFQAQGRYVFALIPILVLVSAERSHVRHPRLFWGLAAAMSVAGLVSFAAALPYLS